MYLPITYLPSLIERSVSMPQAMLSASLPAACPHFQANEPARADQLRGVIERLGPAYVKVAQALSTRVDLLSPDYFMQVQLLQDRVPPFPCEQAKQVSTPKHQPLRAAAGSALGVGRRISQIWPMHLRFNASSLAPVRLLVSHCTLPCAVLCSLHNVLYIYAFSCCNPLDCTA